MKNFSKTLNWVALGIIVCIVLFFIYFLFSSFYHSQDISNKPRPINFTLSEINVKKVDSTMIIANNVFISAFNQKMDSLKVQIAELKEIKAKIEGSEKRNDDYLRLVFALLGSVFAIVGFFGFKSIHDTRENAIKSATIEARNVAIKEANNSSNDIMNRAQFEANRILLETKTDITAIRLESNTHNEKLEEMQKNISNLELDMRNIETSGVKKSTNKKKPKKGNVEDDLTNS